MLRKFLFALIFTVCSLVVLAQDKPQPLQKQDKDKGYTLSVDALEVQLPVSVLDKQGRPVDGLTKENFQIFEDKVAQQIDRKSVV